MSSDLRTKKLGDVVALVVDNRGRNPKSYAENGIPVIDNYLITGDGTVKLSEVKRFIDDETYESFLREYIQEDDVLMTLVGNGYGKVAITPKEMCAIIQNTIGLRCNKNNDNQYLYYLLLDNREALMNLNRGAAQPSIKVGDVLDLEFQFPSLKEQRRVAGILRSIDSVIELNRQTSQTLEQMAQAIFKSWFVDFDPVKAKIAALEAGGSEEDALLAAMQAIAGSALFAIDAADADAQTQLVRLQTEHPEQYATLRATAELFPSAMQESELGEIPEGWVIGCLADLLDFNPRRTLKKGTVAPYLDMKNVPTSGHLADEVVDREMGSGTKFINGDTLLARITPCLENGKTAYVDFLDEGQVGWGSTEYIVIRPKNDYPTSIGYLIARNAQFRQHAIQSMTGTSGRQRANAKALAELPWVIYPKNIVHIFDKVAGVYLALAKNKGDESKALSELRDTLLPRLLSGELSVNQDID